MVTRLNKYIYLYPVQGSTGQQPDMRLQAQVAGGVDAPH